MLVMFISAKVIAVVAALLHVVSSCQRVSRTSSTFDLLSSSTGRCGERYTSPAISGIKFNPGDSGQIKALSRDYTGNQTCYFQVQSVSPITFTLTSKDFCTPDDKLEIYDGSDERYTFNSSSDLHSTYTTNPQDVTLEFIRHPCRRNSSSTYTGFTLDYSVITDNSDVGDIVFSGAIIAAIVIPTVIVVIIIVSAIACCVISDGDICDIC